ncbi:hypothetical protein [Borrelia miyamotoi]|uniref:Lipoprotein n=1 Tax=Borrelia miyamotoi TaxID=47466 RepID=A0AAQ2WVR8_9SPIR|nr:hypothetical protein [Borrelia miyamotoi]AOW96254.1 hypothetical protein AXH25_05090 [Borrelia miyamotoi]QTL84051.1 hypothetical protein bmLB2001_001331 [Borrelia miyamotoi]WAZ85698.1 hypothetical protein O5400_04995 [Borrelia miyamotoi]WAZ91479.1 hypothetical protein O5398_04985 [Borrelia miyamotoi]WAZ92768.1 hypothetical protein O5402_04995 [Borrelia miyamotoi]
MNIIKNIFMTLLFIIFSCSHNLFNKPSSSLIKDYAAIIFDNHKYFYIEEFPLKINLELEFLNTQSRTISQNYHQALESPQFTSERRNFYHNSSNQTTNNLSVGKISILIDSVCIDRLNIKTLKELNEYLKHKNLNSLNLIRFVFDPNIGSLGTSSNQSLFSTQCIVFSYNELIIFNNTIKNKERNINLTLNIANKDLQNNIYHLSPREYDSFIEAENKFVNNTKKGKNHSHFKFKGNTMLFSRVLEKIIIKVNEGKL